MCLVEQFGVGTRIKFNVEHRTCEGCGCIEGWKTGYTGEFVVEGHTNRLMVGRLDVIREQGATRYCPGCGSMLESDMVMCEPKNVGVMAEKEGVIRWVE